LSSPHGGVLGITGFSGSGKTTLLEKLMPELIAAGLSLSSVKHTHHDFDLDRPGKDSYRHRQAGAREVMIGSGTRWALMHELRGAEEYELDALLARMSPVDLVLVEGFKRDPHSKIEVWRPRATSTAPLFPQDGSIIAVATNQPFDPDGWGRTGLPVLDINNIAGIARFVLDWHRGPQQLPAGTLP
jgi:molybdopterin-guanine dinucleotide biosynthesis adapter protein